MEKQFANTEGVGHFGGVQNDEGAQIIREMEEARYIVGCMPEEVRIRKVDLYGDAGSIGVAIILQEGIEAAARTLGKTVEREAVPESWGMRLSAFLSFRAGRAKVYQLEERRGV